MPLLFVKSIQVLSTGSPVKRFDRVAWCLERTVAKCFHEKIPDNYLDELHVILTMVNAMKERALALLQLQDRKHAQLVVM